MPFSYERTQSLPVADGCAPGTQNSRGALSGTAASHSRACGAYVRTSTTIPKVPILTPARAPARFGGLSAAALCAAYNDEVILP